MDLTWCRDDEAAAEALEQLRLRPGDVDEDRVKRKARVACGLISQHLDRTEAFDAEASDTAVILDLLFEAQVQLTIELYLRKDTPFGVFNAYDDEATSFRIGADPLAGIRHLLISGKQQWGIG